MGYLKYIARESKEFFSHSAKILGFCVVLLVLLKAILQIDVTWGEMGLVLLEAAIGILSIWLLYAIIEYFHYRKIK